MNEDGKWMSNRWEVVAHSVCTAFDSADSTDFIFENNGTAYALCICILPTVHMHHIDNML